MTPAQFVERYGEAELREAPQERSERELALSALAMDVDEVIKPLADIRGA